MIPAVGTAAARGTDPIAAPTRRQGQSYEDIVGMAHAKNFEAASAGVLFSACEQGTGIAPGTALGTTALFVLYNPVGSGKRIAIRRVSVGYISGTLGAGTLYHCVKNDPAQTAPSGGTALSVQCNAIGATPPAAGVARVNATVVTPTAVRPFCTLGAGLASTAGFTMTATDDLDDEFILLPGTTYQLQAVAAAGSTPKVTVGCTWEETPLV